MNDEESEPDPIEEKHLTEVLVDSLGKAVMIGTSIGAVIIGVYFLLERVIRKRSEEED